MGIGSIALGLGSVAAVATPASAAPLEVGGNGCFLFVNLGIIPPIAIGCPA